MTRMCEGRTVIVTGGGRGLGREHALEYARHGASVVVNDVGGDVHGVGSSQDVADAVVEEILALGGRAVANYADAADWDGAATIIDDALTHFGHLDVLVNNAGILRDRMFVNMTPDEWHETMRVHLGTVFACTRHAASHWRELSKRGDRIDARVISTSSPSGLYGNVGQTNYGAAKAGIAAFTIIAATELMRFGIAVNAISPGARTRMTENLTVLDGATAEPADFDEMSPANVSPLVVWLGTEAAAGVTGQVFNVWGGKISVAEGWSAGPTADKNDRWTVEELSDVVPNLLLDALPSADMWGIRREPSYD